MTKLILVLWDITTQSTDAIVNAANSTLLWWWGVDGAIHAAGWPAIFDACKEIRDIQYPQGLPTGEAVLTTGGALPAKRVIHTVGPIFSQYRNDSWKGLLAACYANCLKLAIKNGIKSIAFPSISTGDYRCPIEECSKISVEEVKKFIETNPEIEEVRFIVHSEKDYQVYEKLLK